MPVIPVIVVMAVDIDVSIDIDISIRDIDIAIDIAIAPCAWSCPIRSTAGLSVLRPRNGGSS